MRKIKMLVGIISTLTDLVLFSLLGWTVRVTNGRPQFCTEIGACVCSVRRKMSTTSSTTSEKTGELIILNFSGSWQRSSMNPRYPDLVSEALALFVKFVVIATMNFVKRKAATMRYCLHNEMSGDIISLYHFASIFLGFLSFAA